LAGPKKWGKDVLPKGVAGFRVFAGACLQAIQGSRRAATS
jgi:hypothetical protein